MFKKIAFLLFSLVLMVSLVLSGCSQAAPSTTQPASSAAKPATTAPASAAPTSAAPTSSAPATIPANSALAPFAKQELPKFFVAWAQPGGQGEIQTTAISNILTKYSSIKASITLISGGLTKSADSIRGGQVDWFPISPTTPWQAYTGKSVTPALRLRQMYTRDPTVAGNTLGLWVMPNSSIKGGKDLAGKKIAVDPGQAWTPLVLAGILKANGLTDKDITLVNIANYDSGFQMLVDGRVNAVACITGQITQQVSKESNILMIPLTKAETDEISKIAPDINAGMTPENYLGLGKPQWGTIVFDAFFCRPGLNEKTIYTTNDTLFSHLDEWYKVDPRNVMLKVATAATDCGWIVPFHPGAIAWFKDKGIWTAEANTKQQRLIAQEKQLFGDVPDEASFRQLGVIP